MLYLEHGDTVAAIVLRGTVGDTEAGGSVESKDRSAPPVVVRDRRVRCLEMDKPRQERQVQARR